MPQDLKDNKSLNWGRGARWKHAGKQESTKSWREARGTAPRK